MAPGRGGPKGLRYEVLLDSLPPDLQAKWREMNGVGEGLSSPAAGPGLGATAIAAGPAAGGGEVGDFPPPALAPRVPGAKARTAGGGGWQWRWEIIRPALAVADNPEALSAAIARVAKETVVKPNGRTWRPSQTTLRRWLQAYEERGVAGLVRKDRADKGQRRVTVSVDWDTAVPFPEQTRQAILEKLRTRIRSLWKEDVASWATVARLATTRLVELTRAAGLDLPDGEMLALCEVPRTLVEAERRYAVLGTKRKDAKGFADRHQPRVQRHRDGQEPMEVVVGDVHPVDVLVTRPDGTTCTPRLIAWQDVATNRVFATMVILPKGEGIRQEHVVASFVAMVRHPEWGMPVRLYLDNGGEYGRLGFIDDAMRLAADHQSCRRSMTVKTEPYNAAAKPIEGLFAALEKTFRMLPGWIGGNRMVTRSANVGKPPAPFHGDDAELLRSFGAALDFYDTKRQQPRGHLAGRSPREAFAAFVEAGWQRIDADPDALAMAFARPVTRTIDRGELSVDGRKYRADALLARTGEKVTVRIPILDTHDCVFVEDRDGQFLCVATPVPTYGFLDRAGCRDKAARSKVQGRTLTLMARGTEDVDIVTEMEKTAALHEPAPVPESGGTIRLNGALEDAAVAMRALPEPPDEEERVAEARSKRLSGYARLGSLRRATG